MTDSKCHADLDPRLIGSRLRLARDALRLGQNEFAEQAGIARNTYNQYERGVRLIPPAPAVALCKCYHLTMDWIYRGQPDGLPYKLGAAISALKTLLDG